MMLHDTLNDNAGLNVLVINVHGPSTIIIIVIVMISPGAKESMIIII